MRDANPDRITSELNRWIGGTIARPDEVFDAVYAELKQIASRCLRRERPGHLHQTTSIVHEAYVRLSAVEGVRWKSRGHFFAFSARLIRQILVDLARVRTSARRGGGAVTIALDDVAHVASTVGRDVLDVDRMLSELTALDAQKARIVELRFFAGMSLDETAAVLDVSRATVVRQWRLARAWLYYRLRDC